MNEAQVNEQAQQKEATNGALVSEKQAEQQQQEQLGVPEQPPVKMTPEMEEEAKLRAKYPNPQKPSGSAFIHKMLHRGNKKYFDSGDYNMAQSKIKQKIGSTLNQNKPVNSIVTNNNVSAPNDQSANIQQQQQQHQSQPSQDTLSQSPVVSSTPAAPLSNSSNMSPNITSNFNENKSLTTTPNLTSNSYDQVKVTTPVLYSNSTANNANSQNLTPTTNLFATYNLNTTNNSTTLSPSISSNSLLNPHNHQLSSSMSTQSLSSSISTDRLSNIHLNPTNPVCLIDSDEIGHAIPTPECLPQSRKHSIVQSKLATPRTVN